VDEGEEGEDDVSKLLSILGLFSNLGGVLLLLLFGMPVRVATAATAGTTLTWSTSSLTYQLQKFDDIYSALGWFGLGFVIFGTFLQALATLERR